MRTLKQQAAGQYQRLPTVQSPKPAPTSEQIQQRAREIYATRGGVEGMTLNDWLQAELELKLRLEDEGQGATLKDGILDLGLRETPAGDENARAASRKR